MNIVVFILPSFLPHAYNSVLWKHYVGLQQLKLQSYVRVTYDPPCKYLERILIFNLYSLSVSYPNVQEEKIHWDVNFAVSQLAYSL